MLEKWAQCVEDMETGVAQWERLAWDGESTVEGREENSVVQFYCETMYYRWMWRGNVVELKEWVGMCKKNAADVKEVPEGWKRQTAEWKTSEEEYEGQLEGRSGQSA